MKAHIQQPYSSASRKAMDKEIKAQLAEYDRKNMYEVDAMVLWVLHEKFGFGKKKLKLFFDSFNTEIKALIDRYELDDKDDAWLCMRKLKDAGIDIEEWEREAERRG